MPLDDTNWATSDVDAIYTFLAPRDAPLRLVASCPYRRRRSRFSPDEGVSAVAKIALAGVVLSLIAFMSEAVFPDAGLITRLVDGNAVANRNFVGRQILLDGQNLKFTVAGHRYEVVAPSRPLTTNEQDALLGYAAWKGFPAYSADGPLTIDP
jgi:hypothetical protein